MNVASLRLEDPAAGTRSPSPTATVGAVSGAVAYPWGPGPDPSTSSLLDDDDESKDVDDELGDEGAAAEFLAWGSMVARTDWISWTSSSSLSGSMALYSKASEGFGGGVTAAIGRAAMGGEEVVTGFLSPPLSSDSPALPRGVEVRKSRSFERFPPPGPEPPFFRFFSQVW